MTKKLISVTDIVEAHADLLRKTEKEIEVETAIKWGARAIAAFELFQEQEAIKYFIWGEDLFHEALEHAALAKDYGRTLESLQAQVEPVRMSALKVLQQIV